MHNFRSSPVSQLDTVRADKGNTEFIDYFNQLITSDASQAIRLINEDTLSFTSLFLLRPVIEGTPILRYLSTRNKNGLMIINSMVSKDFIRFSQLSRNIRQMAYPVFKWILETGHVEDGLSDEYDEIMDSTALILIKEYKDNLILPVIRKTILNRYRKGLFFHDLVWAFFESRDPNCIVMLAQGLISDNNKDAELSKKLLNFVPGCNQNSITPNEILYLHTLNWFGENYPFLCYTGESFQQKNNPSAFDVSLTAKYLCRKVSVESGKINGNLTEDEIRAMNIFDSLDDKDRILLSNFSYILNIRSYHSWNTWIHYPVEEQIRIALARLGGTPC